MRLLTRYLLKQNLFLMLTVLGVGAGIYLLSDLFDRLDDFLEAGLGLKIILTYFAVKLPLIISQILPAVFMLACVLQLCIMARSRELVALQAGGISFAKMARFFVVYGLVWAIAQFAFSQYLGIQGEAQASRIWREQVRKKNMHSTVLTKLWFTEGKYIVNLKEVWPAKEFGKEATVYEFEEDGLSIKQVMTSQTFTVKGGRWMLHDVRIMDPGMYTVGRVDVISLPLKQDIKAFVAIDPRADPQKLPVWKLYQAMQRLKESGSNVEALRTAWHMKFAYAGSVIVMGLIAVMLATWKDNIYINIGVGLLLTFAYYTVFTVGGSMGQKGILDPITSAWGADILFGSLAIGRILWFTRSRGKIKHKDKGDSRRWLHPKKHKPMVRRT